MSLQEQILDLDVTANQISRGIHAVVLMSAGLDRKAASYMDGFDAICDYLLSSSQTLQEQLDACLSTIRSDSFC